MSPENRAALWDWARGLLPAEAAVGLSISAIGGRLQDGPWVRRDELGRAYLDPETATADSGGLSGGESRVLAIAMSLVRDDHPVYLGEAVTGLDPDGLSRVLDALRHVGGGDKPIQRSTIHREHDGTVRVIWWEEDDCILHDVHVLPDGTVEAKVLDLVTGHPRIRVDVDGEVTFHVGDTFTTLRIERSRRAPSPTCAPQGSSHPAHPRGAPTAVTARRGPSFAAAADSTEGNGKGGATNTD